MFKTGNEAAEFLMHRQKHHCGYPHFHKVMEEIGNPQDAFRTIHIAGTNGKGSTSNFIADILKAMGYTVGLYTSPYLISHYDRIRINGEWIPEDTFRDYANRILPLVDKYDLSMFECDTIIASLYFRDSNVDFAVIEAGVGGRKDATNTIHHPLLSILTTVGMDHMASLGNSIPEIAGEKAGILKPDCMALAGYLLPEAMQVVREKAKEIGALLKEAERPEITGKNAFSLQGISYTLSSSADYQKRNASVALQACQMLGVDISDQRVIDAVSKSFWAGRFETVSTHPLVIIDGAHNPEGIKALTDSFSRLPHPIITVFSALRDKQGTTMAQMLKTASDRLIVTEFESYRADDADHLAGGNNEVITDWKEAVSVAMSAVNESGCVIISGSLYFISVIREYFFEKNTNSNVK